MREHHDTVAIGGGQTGLAMSRCWKREREHVVLERRRVGERWRTERGTLFVFSSPTWQWQGGGG